MRFRAAGACASAFAVARNSVVAEGLTVELKASTECAKSCSWSAVSGPGPRVADPLAANLFVTAPRVGGDTVIVYRFTAEYADGPRSADVRVRIREAIPEPHFSLPESLDWSGSAPLTLRPTIPEPPGIKASRDSVLRYAWSVTPAGFPVDSAWQAGSLLLRGASAKGPFAVELCLDNSWTPQCRKTALRVATPLAVPHPRGRPARTAAGSAQAKTGIDAAGRRARTGSAGPVRRFARPWAAGEESGAEAAL